MSALDGYRWVQIRDPITCGISHEYQNIFNDSLVRITKQDRRYRVEMISRGTVPFHRKTLKSAKGDAEWILDYGN